MTTGVSIPEDLYNELEARAREQARPPSALVAEAIRRYLRQFEEEEVTRQLNELFEEQALDPEDKAMLDWALGQQLERTKDDIW